MKSDEKSFERPPDAAEEHGLSFFTPERSLVERCLLWTKGCSDTFCLFQYAEHIAA